MFNICLTVFLAYFIRAFMIRKFQAFTFFILGHSETHDSIEYLKDDKALKRTIGYNDFLDVYGIHTVEVIVGAVLTGVFLLNLLDVPVLVAIPAVSVDTLLCKFWEQG